MNERIQELAKQAEDHADSQGFFVTIDFASDYQDCLMEKFAELIVQECVAIVDDAERGGSNEIWDNAVKFIKRDLLEHFGVK